MLNDSASDLSAVTEEIRQLADSSRETANRIQEINEVVINAVHNLSENANTLIDYLNDIILPEFENFVQSGVQYRENATFVENTMNEFSGKTDGLKLTIDGIADSIKVITIAITDGIDGVNGAAENTQILVSDMENITNRMGDNYSIAKRLQNETEIFVKF